MVRSVPRRRFLALFLGLIATITVLTAAASRAAVTGSPNSRLLVTQVSKSTEWSSGEGWVVASPVNPQVLAADWTSFPWASPTAAELTPPGPRSEQCGEGYSTDGGVTWTEGTLPFQAVGLPTNAGGCADPTIVTDSNGIFYALATGGSTFPGAGTDSPSAASFCCIFTVSSDGGRTWTNPTQVATFEEAPQTTLTSGSPDAAFDRPWLIIDPVTSTLYGSISDDALVQRVVFASHDHGKTWTTPYPLDPDNQTVWGDVISAANGVLAAAYRVDPDSKGYQTSPSPAVRCDQVCAVFETTTDDGKTWARHLVPAAQVARASGLGPGLEVAADPSTAGRYAVLVPVTAGSQEVWVTRDTGATWTRTSTITAPDSDTITKPWIAYGPTGTLGVVWRNLHSDNTYEVNAIVSINGGRTFGSPVELTPGTAPADPPPQGTPGDDCACNLHLNNKYLYTTWGDSRGGNLQIWFARYRY